MAIEVCGLRQPVMHTGLFIVSIFPSLHIRKTSHVLFTKLKNNIVQLLHFKHSVISSFITGQYICPTGILCTRKATKSIIHAVICLGIGGQAETAKPGEWKWYGEEVL